ncbi:MAG: [Fe-Fe] hydrogenase large subunit C-terminal domain-containing protein [Deltaproteobacteria bacterium]|nr:[Fe-Fe] hydrogenase large subunit C-terminal domain-containing protein [Deltaproteobacteria bacterium]
MGIVSTIPARCRRCYTCVRECPAKAIKVEGGQAVVIENRCIVCGNCVKVCAQNAKRIEDGTGAVSALIASGRKIFACLAPSFPAAFDTVSPGKLIAAVRGLGFHEVWEVAFGAELISREYVKLFEKSQRTGIPVIATPCPSVVAYIEKYMPPLHPFLAPIVSPMVAVARAIKQRHGAQAGVVFIGPCIAKKQKVTDPASCSDMAGVLTFEELEEMFAKRGIVPDEMNESSFDGPRAYLGRSLAVSGGLLKPSGLSSDILENGIIVTEGKSRVIAALEELATGRPQAHFYDMLFCNGCIDGPAMCNKRTFFARKELLVEYLKEQNRYTTQRELAEGLGEFSDLDLSRSFTLEDLDLPVPAEADITRVLSVMKKGAPEDQLNCGACGYHTCREKAIAVCQGLAEPEMCLPYLVEELEETCDRLQQSHSQLESTQQRLLKTERLASMGQLSAGVAHELNNPLGTILLYSHMLMKELDEQDRRRSDIKLIVAEAVRCKDIVRGLLDFARQSRVSKAPVDVRELLREVVALSRAKGDESNVIVSASIADDLPIMMLDRMQIRQALVNLIVNGIDSIDGGGELTVKATLNGNRTDLIIKVEDTGCGIPKENLAKLFTPFFTTKESGHGTGLGLAITYGIVKMHSGDITVDSELGRGSTFTLRLPVQQSEESVKEYKIDKRFFE